MANKPTLPEAIKVLQDALLETQEQGSYFYVWQSNIAMAFADAAKKYFDADGSYLMTQENLIEISNNAAKNFLNTLCEPDPKTV